MDELLPLNPVDFMVLLVLLDGDSYGYAIVRAMRDKSDGRIDVLPGNFYTVLQRLLRDGLIAPSDTAPPGSAPGRPRRMFRITDLGRRVARAEATRLTEIADDPGVRGLVAEADGSG